MLVRAWPPGRPRILVTDAWLANGGDAAIALATQRRLARLVPGAAVLHAAYQGDLLAAELPELALVPPLAGLLGVAPAIPEMAGWSPEDADGIVAGADVVLCQGGGYAMAHYEPWERLRAWEIVVERGVPIGFGAQTVGPFAHEPERGMLERVYAAAEVIALREQASVRHVLELGARPEQLLVCADEAFSTFGVSQVPEAQRRGIACVLSRDPQLRADGALAAPETSVDAHAALVTALVARSAGEGVTLLSTFQGLGARGRGLEDDAGVAAEVVAALAPDVAAQVRTVPGVLGPQACANVLAAQRALVSTRMHPAIFGVALGIPTVLVSQAYKAIAMFEGLGLGALLVARPDPEAVAGRLAAPRADPTRALERCAWNDRVVARLLQAVA
jgi:polysaccharide pyruvyl transferase WcaK-like protein